MTNGNGSPTAGSADRIAGMTAEEEGETESSKSQLADPLGVQLSREDTASIACPVCGATAIQEKCKVLCKSEVCRGRVIMNCAEF
jgi:hypothetical protein